MIDINFSKDVLLKILSSFFCHDISAEKSIAIRIHGTELGNHPSLYLLRFLLYCEQNCISPENLRIIYVDSLCSLNDNLIRIRFPEYAAFIYFVTFAHGKFKIPEIESNPDSLSILILDNIHLLEQSYLPNNDLRITLLSDC